MDFIEEANRIYTTNEEGTIIAEITFPETEDGVCTIDHTFVAESLRGQHIASQLTEAAVEQIKAQGKKVQATCPYAQSWLAK